MSWLQTHLPTNALAALLAAVSWGGGDFSGGMAVKVSGGGTRASLRVIVIAHSVSLAVLGALYLFPGGNVPHEQAVLWALLAGVTAGLSITAFYVALARGAMGAPAAVSGLLAAAVPAAASSFLEGRPGTLQLVGFLVAGVAIWFIAAAPPSESSETPGNNRAALWLAVLGGLGFGIYFLLLRLANPLGVLLPIVLARTGSVTTCAAMLTAMRLSSPPIARGTPKLTRPTSFSARVLRWTLGAALLDTGGNLLFVLSTRLGRLDVASVLAALYPAGTILLAALYLKERPARLQWAGMGLALAAVILVTI